MDDQRLHELMNHFDDDLMEQELDELMGDIEIDMDSISQKAHWKLRKGQRKMNKSKKKAIAIVAVSLVAVCTVTTVYASEISQFIQSLMNKTGVYGAVVDGTTYYLENPVALGEGQNLTQAMLQEHGLDIQLDFRGADGPDIRIKMDGKEMEPNGMEGYNNLTFYGVEPTSSFDLIVDGVSYPVVLSTSQPIVDDSEIVEAEPNDIQWVSMGYKKIPDGIQILTTFEDENVELGSLLIPESDRVTETFENREDGSSGGGSQHEELLPLTGSDANGNTYVYEYNTSDMGWPSTKFTSNAPANQEITLHVPGIAVYYNKELALDVALPNVGEMSDARQTIDLGLQTMELQRVERTSETTATLSFKLNTGKNPDVRIWNALIDERVDEASLENYVPLLKKGDLLWENGTCTMNVTFDKDLTNLKLLVQLPKFIVEGNWTMVIS